MARIVASGDTLAGFLRELKARYPEMQALLPDARGQPPAPRRRPIPTPTGSLRAVRNRLSAR